MITFEVRLNDKLLVEQIMTNNTFMQMLKGEIPNITFELLEDVTIDAEEETVVETENECDYGHDSSPIMASDTGTDWTLENGKRYHIPCRRHPERYCEECGKYLYEDRSKLSMRGEVWDRRITKIDPIYMPMYYFCSDECLVQFRDVSMAARYGDRPPKLTVELNYESYDRFARVLVNGIEVYTVSGDNILFDHGPGSFPTLQLTLPVHDYTFVGSVLGPGNV